MKKTLLILVIYLFSYSFSQAQTDTTKYDLGRLQMDKKLTQAITIKAADLEKMPFNSLADAINVWIYGVYGGHPSYVPVIDGIVMTDVSALSIYDIDQITLVQNASAVLNGASPQQFLLLIKTRRNRPGKSGIDIAGQTNLIKRQGDQSIAGKNSTRVYDQYYLSGYVNTSNIHAGLSADLQRDASPLSLQSSGANYNLYSEALTRYKFNGYLDANLGSSSTLSISAGYIPQNGDGTGVGSGLSSSTSSTSSTINTLSEHLYYNNISLKSSFSGFKNTLTGAYQHLTTKNGTAITQDVIISSSTYSLSENNVANYTNNNVALKDNLSYAFKTGHWDIEPNVNFMYRHYKTSEVQNLQYLYTTTAGIPVYDTTATTNNDLTLKQTLLTPALNINYGKTLMLQGGFQVMLSHPASNTQGFKPKTLYPFASVMLNISDKETHATGLSVFGSFAKVNSYMGDVNNYIAYSSSISDQFAATTYYVPTIVGNINPYNNYNQWQAGTNFNFFSNKLSLSYNFSHQQFGGAQTGSSSNYNYTGNFHLHRFGFDINWAKTDKFSWETNLNTSFIKGVLYVNPATIVTHNLTTGGFVNRLNYKKAFLGADVLYILHDNTSYVSGPAPQNYHALNLQNLYAGFKVNVKGTKNLEIYANARSIAETKNSTILDTRKYYGLGFKLGL